MLINQSKQVPLDFTETIKELATLGSSLGIGMDFDLDPCDANRLEIWINGKVNGSSLLCKFLTSKEEVTALKPVIIGVIEKCRK